MEESTSHIDFHKGKRHLSLKNATDETTSPTSPTETIIGNKVEKLLVTELIVIEKYEQMGRETLISEIGLLKNLEILDLTDNELIGPLPNELFQLNELSKYLSYG